MTSEEKSPLGYFIQSLGDGGKAKIAKTLNVSRSIVTLWALPLSHKAYRKPRLENAIRLYEYSKTTKMPLRLEDMLY